MMQRGLSGLPLLAGVALLAAPLALPAQRDTTRVYGIDTLTVTTRRYAALRTEIPQKIEVITRAEIERTAANDVAEVLKKRAGVDIVEYPGLLAGIGIRGFRPEVGGINNRTLVLIDGRPAGSNNLATFDLTSIERIEMVKGPASSLYGSSAMAGVVNIITRRSTGQPTGSATTAYGSFDTREARLRLGGALPAGFDADVGFRYFRQADDFRIGSGNLLRGTFGGDSAQKRAADGTWRNVPEIGSGRERDNTRYGSRGGSARLGYTFAPGLRADARGELFDADDVETPGDLYASYDGSGRKNVGRRTGEVSLSGARGPHDALARFYTAREGTDYFNLFAPTPFVSYVGESRTRGAQLQDAVRFGPSNVVTGGFDYTAADATSRVFSGAGVRSAPYSPDYATRSAAAFAEGKLGFWNGRATATLGARADRVSLVLRETLFRTGITPGTERFTSFNPSAGLQARLVPGVRAHGSIGRAFVAPDAFEKAGIAAAGAGSGSVAFTLGNPALRPESSVTWDAGLGLAQTLVRGLDADVTYFQTDVRDRITAASAFFGENAPRTAQGDVVGYVTTYTNAARARIRGLDWTLGYDLGALLGRGFGLRAFTNGTKIFRAEETARAAAVDAARFAGRADFAPEQVLGAITFGEALPARDLYNVADLNVNYGLGFDTRPFQATFSGRYVGERLDVDYSDFQNVSDIRYPGSMVLDLVSSVRLRERYKLGFEVRNLTDENYYEKRGYNLPGRALRVSVTAEI